MDIRPIILEGRVVRLEPLSMDHYAGLCAVGFDPELWRWTPNLVQTPEQMGEYMKAALDAQARGSELPFATCDRASGRAVGSTRFGNIDRANRRVEIGWTWGAPPRPGTAVKPQAKDPMLRDAIALSGGVGVGAETGRVEQ